MIAAQTRVMRLLQARDRNGGLVAIKLLHPRRAQDAEERATLAHEIRLGQRLAGQKRRGLSISPWVALRQPENPSSSYAVFDWQADTRWSS